MTVEKHFRNFTERLTIKNTDMTGVNYVTNDKGEKTALLIDLAQLRSTDKTEADLNEFLEDLDDVIAAELSIGQQGRPYEEVRKDIIKGQK